MTKTKYQQAGIDYAKEYLDKLLEMEYYVGRKLDRIVEQKVKRYIKSDKGTEHGLTGREMDDETKE